MAPPKTSFNRSQRGTSSRGRTSRGSSSSQPMPFDDRFISEERERRFLDDFKDRNIKKGKIINFTLLSSGNIFVGQRLRALGWDQFLSINRPFYPDLIKEFYVNLEYSSHDQCLHSKVNNKVFQFSNSALRDILGLTNDSDVSPPVQTNAWPEFQHYQPMLANRYLVSDRTLMLHEPPLYNQLNLNSRLIQSIITHNILPHTGSKTYISRYEAFLIYCIHTGIHLDLSILIFRHMTSVLEKPNMSLPYPSLLTHLFEMFHVDLRGATRVPYSTLDNLDAVNLKKMGYKLESEDSNVWVLKTGEPDSHSGTWTPAADAPSSSRSRVRQRTEEATEDVPPAAHEGSSSSSWENRFFTQYQTDYDAQMTYLQSMMSGITTLNDGVASLQQNFQSFRDDTRARFDSIEHRMAQWDHYYGGDAAGGGDGHGDGGGDGNGGDGDGGDDGDDFAGIF